MEKSSYGQDLELKLLRSATLLHQLLVKGLPSSITEELETKIERVTWHGFKMTLHASFSLDMSKLVEKVSHFTRHQP